MRVLLAGGNGQVGGALNSQIPTGCALVSLGRESFDITDARQVSEVVATNAPDYIVNAAAYTAVDKAEADSDLAFRVNRDGARNLARAAASSGARLLHLSTDFVFDGRSGVPYEPDHAVSPLGVYGASKAAGEQAVLEALPGAIVLRTAWIYDAHGANFLTTMLRLMESRSEVRVVSDQIGTPTHALSLARAICQLFGSDVSGIHHFTDAGVASWYDFAVAIQEEALALGLLTRPANVIPIRTCEFPTPARRPSYSVLDKTQTYAALGRPAAHWRSELRSALRILKESQNA